MNVEIIEDACEDDVISNNISNGEYVDSVTRMPNSEGDSVSDSDTLPYGDNNTCNTNIRNISSNICTPKHSLESTGEQQTTLVSPTVADTELLNTMHSTVNNDHSYTQAPVVDKHPISDETMETILGPRVANSKFIEQLPSFHTFNISDADYSTLKMDSTRKLNRWQDCCIRG